MKRKYLLHDVHWLLDDDTELTLTHQMEHFLRSLDVFHFVNEVTCLAVTHSELVYQGS